MIHGTIRSNLESIQKRKLVCPYLTYFIDLIDLCFVIFIYPLGLEEEPEPVRRASLVPPPQSGVAWREYIESKPGEYPLLG